VSETQFTTKIGGKSSLGPSYFAFGKFSFPGTRLMPYYVVKFSFPGTRLMPYYVVKFSFPVTHLMPYYVVKFSFPVTHLMPYYVVTCHSCPIVARLYR
jgi:hypothetical protein